MEKQISHFKVLEEIGSGGMGVVYRARDQRLRRKVALKVLPAGALAEPMIRERLMREAQTTSSLNHPYIVTVFDIHSAGDRDFIAMEFVEGDSLDHVIGEQGLPLDRALRYALQIADGLACAHEHGVIHRDLKPQNIMVRPSDDVKILDFGLAKRFLPAGDGETSIEPGLMTLTAPGVKIGTPAYMSPEQIESRPIDARSDIFSYGCLLYQMLTGVNPFQRRNAILIFKAVLSDQPGSVRALKPGLPVELERILTRAMEKSPEDRYQDMRELLSDLKAVHVELFGPGTPGARSRPPVGERFRRAGWRVPLLVVLPLAVAAALIWWLTSRSADPPRLDGHRVLASVTGSGRQADFSPAGDRIVFVDQDSSGVSGISTVSLEGGPPTRITSADGVDRPGWSVAGGGSIVFGQGGGGVWSVALEPGSQPRPVLERATNPRLSADGRRLAAELDGQVWTASVAGDDSAPVASIPPAFFSRWVARSPALSPGGRQVAYYQPAAGSAGSLWVAPAGGGESRRLLAETFRGGDPAWTPDGRWVVFWADLGGATNLWCVPAIGGEPERLTHGAGRHTGPAISGDGRRLAYTAASPSFALERLGPETGEFRRLFESRHEIGRLAVSPSGDRVAFHAPDGPDVHLFMMEADGGVARVTGGAGESDFLPRWSADGSHLYFYQERPEPSYRKVPATGGASTEVLGDWSRHVRYDTAVDPRGRRVVYTPIEDGEPRWLRVRELDEVPPASLRPSAPLRGDAGDAREHQLGAILLAPVWSADGTEVLGSDVSDRIYLCPAAGGDCRFLAEGFAPRWGSSEGALHFARRAGAPRDRIQTLSIWTLAIDSLKGRKIAEVEAAGALAFGYGFLAGGDLIWNRLIPGHEEIWIADFE